MKIKNQYGKEFNFDDICMMMDSEIREAIHDREYWLTEQEFFDRYCQLHREKFGEEFEYNKLNPQV